MNTNAINNQPLFGKNSNVINSPKNSKGLFVGNIKANSPVTSISLTQSNSQHNKQASSALQNTGLSSFSNSHSFSAQSPMSNSVASPFNLLFENNNHSNGMSHNQGLISNDHTPLRLLNSPLSAGAGNSNNISSMRSNSLALNSIHGLQGYDKSPKTGLVSKSYKFDDNSKELQKTILYIKNKKSFVTSKQTVDMVFFELLNRLSGRTVTITSADEKKTQNNAAATTNLVTFNGNEENSNIIHISNNSIKHNANEKISRKVESSASTLSSYSSSALATSVKEDSLQPSTQPIINRQQLFSSDFFKECDLCPKVFDNPHSYKMHKKQHVIMNGGKNVCPKCYKGFARTDAMKRHLGTKTCERNRRKLIEENNGIMPERPPTEVNMEKELDS